nr:uncharacterized protein LOC121502646 [Drosophila kikkawai]
MSNLSDTEEDLNISEIVARQQRQMSEALNCSLAEFSRRLAASSSVNTAPISNIDVAVINGDDEDWWTPRSANNKRRLVSGSPSSATKILKNSNALILLPTNSMNCQTWTQTSKVLKQLAPKTQQ